MSIMGIEAIGSYLPSRIVRMPNSIGPFYLCDDSNVASPLSRDSALGWSVPRCHGADQNGPSNELIPQAHQYLKVLAKPRK